MSEYFLEVKDVYKSFQAVKALKGVSLRIKPGEAHCLAGENGCGKSTLIKAISGVHSPDSGQIIINGEEKTSMTPMEAARAGIQVIYQDFALFHNLTVAENIGMSSNLTKGGKFYNKKHDYVEAARVLKDLGVDIPLDTIVDDLPIAQRQIVAIARALVEDAKLVIMDEPTTALTTKEVEKLIEIIRGLKQRGIALLFVSHKLDEVMAVSETITICRNGENVISGSVDEFDKSKITYYMTGKEIDRTKFSNKITDDVILEVKNLTQTKAYRDINFKLFGGEVLGITGLLGSGRQELAETLFGMQGFIKGEIIMKGKTLKLKNSSDAVAAGIGYVPEDRLVKGLFLNCGIGRNISASLLNLETNRFGFLKKKRIAEIVDKQIEHLRIKIGSVTDPATSLSGGNQQRVVIAKWLGTKPKVLILNCPTVGVDVGSKSEIHQLARELAAEGIGVIVISDDLPEILQMCNRVIVMNHGEITGCFDTDSVEEAELQQRLAKG